MLSATFAAKVNVSKVLRVFHLWLTEKVLRHHYTNLPNKCSTIG